MHLQRLRPVLVGQPIPIAADALLGGLPDAGFVITLLKPGVTEKYSSITAVSCGLKIGRQHMLADGTSVRTGTTFGRATVTVASQTVGAIAALSTFTADPAVPAPDAAPADTAPRIDSSGPTPSTTGTGVRTPSTPDPPVENPVVAPRPPARSPAPREVPSHGGRAGVRPRHIQREYPLPHARCFSLGRHRRVPPTWLAVRSIPRRRPDGGG